MLTKVVRLAWREHAVQGLRPISSDDAVDDLLHSDSPASVVLHLCSAHKWSDKCLVDVGVGWKVFMVQVVKS